jgi:hypothetical protein
MQRAFQRALAESQSPHLRKGFSAQVTENVARWHLQKKATTQLFQHRRRVVPADAMGNVVREIFREGEGTSFQLKCPDGYRKYSRSTCFASLGPAAEKRCRQPF